jgi:uncharacterized protein YcfJ
MKRIFLWALLLAMITGCASAERWVRDNPGTVTGIAAGVVTGGLAGGIIGHQVGHTAGGILIGSGIGGVAGGLIGNAVEDRRTSSACSSSPSSMHSSTCARYDPAVADLQRSLKRSGYDCGPVDGIMGSRTRQAIMNFQRDRGIQADGIPGPLTRAKMGEVKTSG